MPGAARLLPQKRSNTRSSAPPSAGRRRSKLRPRLLLAKAHRWASFALGLLLLAVVLSGTVLLLEPEIEQLTHPSLYETDSGPVEIGPGRALATVQAELPDFEVAETSIVENRGAWEVNDFEAGEVARVDSTSGELLGTVDRNHGVLGFIGNLHMCALGCEEMSGYVPFLGKPAELAGVDLMLGNEGTWGGFILLVSAILLALLSLSGLILWWPGRKRLPRGFQIRHKGGAYKLNYDLHKVAGLIALPFLFMWAFTGINFEWPEQMSSVYYAIMPGSKPAEAEEFTSRPTGERTVSMGEAVELAKADPAIPDDAVLTAISNPNRAEAGSHYELYFASGIDPWAYSTFPGNFGAEVDLHTGRTVITLPNQSGNRLSNDIYENWAGTTHFGNPVGWLPRLGWVLFGLAPLLLAATGITTWWLRRRKGRRRLRPE